MRDPVYSQTQVFAHKKIKNKRIPKEERPGKNQMTRGVRKLLENYYRVICVLVHENRKAAVV